MGTGSPGLVQDPQISGSEGDTGLNHRRIIAAVVFGIGVLVGMIILGASVYADFESALYEIFLKPIATPGLVSCPILISSDEGGVVTASLKNTGDVRIQRVVRVFISRGHRTMMREIEQPASLAPGEEVQLQWGITKNDAAYGNLVFAKVQFTEDGRIPLQRGSCGILVFDLPLGLKGATIVTTLYLISNLFILSAMVVWWRFSRSYTGVRKEATNAIFVLGFVVLAGLLLSWLGVWELAAAAFYLAILAIGIVGPHFVINMLRAK